MAGHYEIFDEHRSVVRILTPRCSFVLLLRPKIEKKGDGFACFIRSFIFLEVEV